MLEIIQNANQALRFLLELCALIAYAFSGWQLGNGTVYKVALAVGLPIIAALVWGLFGAPAASRRLQDPFRLVLEILVFGGAVLALARAGYPSLAIAYAVIFSINRILMYVWGQ